MEISCYMCDGFGTWADGRKCINCGGTGRDRDTERLLNASTFVKEVKKEIGLTKFQEEFLEKWLCFAWKRGWEVGKASGWAQTFRLSDTYKHPLAKLYDIYPDMETFEKELKELTRDLDDPVRLELCLKDSRAQIIKMDSGEVIFIDPEGLFSFTQEY